MAEQNDPVLKDVMNLLEIESADAPATLPMATPTFQPSANSLQFSFARANAKKLSVCVFLMTR